MRPAYALLALTFAASVSAQKVYSEHDPGVVAPRVIEKAAGEYTEEARKARLEGTVVVTAIVEANGSLRDAYVSRPLGLGLDEKAVEAVKQWQIAPATKDGQPVPVLARFDVNFRMLIAPTEWYLTRADFETPRGASRPLVVEANFPPPTQSVSNIAISFYVDEQGQAINASDLADVMRGWKFQPATKDGKPIRVPATFRFSAGPPRGETSGI